MKCSNFYRMSPTMGGHLFWYPFCYPNIEHCIECDFEFVLPFIHISRICHRTWHANLKIDGKNDIFDLLVRFVFVIMLTLSSIYTNEMNEKNIIISLLLNFTANVIYIDIIITYSCRFLFLYEGTDYIRTATFHHSLCCNI